jgi:signal transduction histidine kinase
MAERISSLLASQQRLLSDVSHELRSPLARLELALALARKQGDNAAAFGQMEKDLARLDEIIGDLLLLPRLEHQQVRRDDLVDLVALVDDIVAGLGLEAQADNKAINWQSRVDSLALPANHSLLHSAIDNIVRNALAHSPPAGSVDILLELVAGEAVLRVRDHGEGVPETELEAIFEPFYRVDQARARRPGGVGLGLAIARRAVESHDGSLVAHNRSPGLEMTIRLPLPG